MKKSIRGSVLSVTVPDETKARLTRIARRCLTPRGGQINNDPVARGVECDQRAELVRRILEEASLAIEEAMEADGADLTALAYCSRLEVREVAPRWLVRMRQDEAAVQELLADVGEEVRHAS